MVQEILYWQSRTVQSMYKRVIDAMQQAGNTGDPKEYLQFFFPGQREKDRMLPRPVLLYA